MLGAVDSDERSLLSGLWEPFAERTFDIKLVPWRGGPVCDKSSLGGTTTESGLDLLLLSLEGPFVGACLWNSFVLLVLELLVQSALLLFVVVVVFVGVVGILSLVRLVRKSGGRGRGRGLGV